MLLKRKNKILIFTIITKEVHTAMRAKAKVSEINLNNGVFVSQKETAMMVSDVVDVVIVIGCCTDLLIPNLRTTAKFDVQGKEVLRPDGLHDISPHLSELLYYNF